MAPSSKILSKIHFILPVYLLFLTLSCEFANAQSLDDKASKILKESQVAFESLQDFSANIAYTIRNDATQNGRPISQKGTYRSKGDKYVIDLGEQVIYCDGITQWIYSKEDNEVNILYYDPEEGLNLESIFQIYEAIAQFQYKGVESIQNRSHDKIFIVIADKRLDYNQAVLWIDQSTKLTSKILLKDRNQTSTEILFANIKINQNLPDSGFVFDTTKFPGLEIYDER